MRTFARTIGISCLCVLAVSIANQFIITAEAQLHGREYSGVVLFDRWDSCYLISGTYVTYVSKSAKEALRPYNGMAIQVHADDVSRESNPGDVLIREYKMIGPAPDTHHYAVLDGLKLVAQPDFETVGNPSFVVEIRNAGTDTTTIMSRYIGPVLLGPSPRPPFSPPGDDISSAIVTHGNILNSFGWRSYDGQFGTRSAEYTVDLQSRPSERFQLAPGQSMKTRISFIIPAGQYQVLFGYGGGFNDEKSLVSNAISFNVADNGLATIIN
jgi:hypothetical protein